VLLLDEPLAHLDPLTRKTLRIELAKLHRDLAVTTIHVTRDAADALALSDRLAVLHDGQVAQLGEPSEVYQHPRTRVVAEALGPANFLPVRVVEVRDLGVVVETEGGHRVPVAGVGEYREGSRGLLVLRPELLSMTDAAMAGGPACPARSACACSRARASSTRSTSAPPRRYASSCRRSTRDGSFVWVNACASSCRARRRCWCPTPAGPD